jgi:1-deoxy-D-xylulose-5-phosphate synthase
VVGNDGATHNGVFDIAYLRCLPNFTLMAPRDTGELVQMMELAATCDGPVAIRFPRGPGAQPHSQVPQHPFEVGEAETVAEGTDGCMLAYGPMTYVALEVRRRIEETTGLTLAVVNARFAKPLDEKLIAAQLERQPVIFTLEDHVIAGGFGAAVAEFAIKGRHEAGKLEILALPDVFIDHGERSQQFASVDLDTDAIVEKVRTRLEAIEPVCAPVRLVKRT